jgi:hypothetical protein
MITELQNRELNDEDYSILLQLDSTSQEQGSIPLHIINKFPILKLCTERDRIQLRLDQSRNCKVCVESIRYGEIARQLPCGHGFHQQCIDKWLLNQRSTCPTCGSVAYCDIGNEMDDNIAIDLEAARYKPAKSSQRTRKQKSIKIIKSSKEPSQENCLLISGLCSSRFPRIAMAAESSNQAPSLYGARLQKISSQHGSKTFGQPQRNCSKTEKIPLIPNLSIDAKSFSIFNRE